MNWMQRLKRVFHIDIEHCGVGGGTLRVIACIDTPEPIETILTHLAAREQALVDFHFSGGRRKLGGEVVMGVKDEAALLKRADYLLHRVLRLPGSAVVEFKRRR